MTDPIWPDRPVGVDRSNDPLMSLHEKAEPFRTAIMRTQWYLSYVTGCSRAPIWERWTDRLHHPRPGDLVYVSDHALHDRATVDTRTKSFGYYILGRREPCYSPDIWAEIKDQFEGERCPTEPIFYIQYGPAPEDVCRWENAECRVIATEETTRECRTP